LVSVDLPLVHPGYDETILSLVEVTLDHVQDKFKSDAVTNSFISAMAQHLTHHVHLRKPTTLIISIG